MPRQVAESVQYAWSRLIQPSPSGAGASGALSMSVPSSAFDMARSPASSGRTVANTSVRIGMPSSVIARPRPRARPLTSHVKYATPSGSPSRLWVRAR